MKIKGSFVLKKILSDYIVVPVGNNLVDFNAVITLNETGAFLWEKLQNVTTKEALCDLMCEEYDIDKDTAMSDINEFAEKLNSAGILCNE